MFKQLTLNNILSSFKKTINDLDSLLSLLKVREEAANGRVNQAMTDLVEITGEKSTASKIKENLEKLIEGV